MKLRILLGCALLTITLPACSNAPIDDESESIRDVSTDAIQLPDEFDPADVTNDANALFDGLEAADFNDFGGGYTPEGAAEAPGAAAHSMQKFDSAIKSQGQRPWCTAFATVGAIENIIRRSFGENVNLSEHDHWNSYRQYSVFASVDAAAKTRIVPELAWPYYGNPVSNYRSQAIARITSKRTLTSQSQLLDALSQDHPVVLGVSLTTSFRGNHTGEISPNGATIGGHAMTIVGYSQSSQHAGGGYLVVRNSWGSQWGDLGYARIPYAYCKKIKCYLIEIAEVEYKGRAAGPSTNPPNDPPSNGNQGGEINAQSFGVEVTHAASSPDRFKLHLTASPAVLAKVSSVTYDVHETFGKWRYAQARDPNNGFEIPQYYKTIYHRWTTNGAIVTLTDGRVVELGGTLIEW